MGSRNHALRPRIAGITLSAVVMVTLASSMAAQGLARFTANGVQRAASAANAPVSELALGITEFGYRLSQQTASPSKNWVASPLSIAYTFAMARAGASGETAMEIDPVFGFPPSGTDEAFSAATSEMVIDHEESTSRRPAPRRGSSSAGRPPDRPSSRTSTQPRTRRDDRPHQHRRRTRHHAHKPTRPLNAILAR
jgi:hypothetical protein